MGEVPATLVKELREKTGAGIMECKSALVDTGGDIESAIDWLRNRKLAVVSDTLEKLEKGGPSISFSSHAEVEEALEVAPRNSGYAEAIAILEDMQRLQVVAFTDLLQYRHYYLNGATEPRYRPFSRMRRSEVHRITYSRSQTNQKNAPSSFSNIRAGRATKRDSGALSGMPFRSQACPERWLASTQTIL
jgi:hypothetical protein